MVESFSMRRSTFFNVDDFDLPLATVTVIEKMLILTLLLDNLGL